MTDNITSGDAFEPGDRVERLTRIESIREHVRDVPEDRNSRVSAGGIRLVLAELDETAKERDDAKNANETARAANAENAERWETTQDENRRLRTRFRELDAAHAERLRELLELRAWGRQAAPALREASETIMGLIMVAITATHEIERQRGIVDRVRAARDSARSAARTFRHMLRERGFAADGEPFVGGPADRADYGQAWRSGVTPFAGFPGGPEIGTDANGFRTFRSTRFMAQAGAVPVDTDAIPGQDWRSFGSMDSGPQDAADGFLAFIAEQAERLTRAQRESASDDRPQWQQESGMTWRDMGDGILIGTSERNGPCENPDCVSCRIITGQDIPGGVEIDAAELRALARLRPDVPVRLISTGHGSRIGEDTPVNSAGEAAYPPVISREDSEHALRGAMRLGYRWITVSA